ncbi:hypothetical protein F5884DRAFT_792005 [Xylogone sp. PMI_703]|nr:hypothetical protein F5884DRAFT_792005 [Xylogone sp. PMI_703]
MATAETVDLSPPHPPREESITTFIELMPEIKKALVHLRHSTTKHDPSYFAAVGNLSNSQLTNFSEDNLLEVRTANTAYGMHLFGKVLIPDSHLHSAYFMFRAFISGEAPKLHSIRMDEIEEPDGGKSFKAIFSAQDPLEWFDT